MTIFSPLPTFLKAEETTLKKRIEATLSWTLDSNCVVLSDKKFNNTKVIHVYTKSTHLIKFDSYENNSEFDSCFVTKPYVSQMILCQWFYYCNWIFKQSTYKLPEGTDNSSKTCPPPTPLIGRQSSFLMKSSWL